MNLIIVRHAAARDRDPDAWSDDAQRPLSERGERRFKKMARKLGRYAPEVHEVYSSSAVRAVQSARILHEEAGWPQPKIVAVLAPGTPAEETHELLARLPPDGTFAFVGHEPMMSDVICDLLGIGNGGVILRTGSAALLELPSPLKAARVILVWLFHSRMKTKR